MSTKYVLVLAATRVWAVAVGVSCVCVCVDCVIEEGEKCFITAGVIDRVVYVFNGLVLLYVFICEPFVVAECCVRCGWV